MGIRHTFIDPKPDGPDTTIVRPSDWNASHVGGYYEPLTNGMTGAMPSAFAVPADATPEDVANAINALLAAPQLVYVDGDVIMVEVF